MFLFLLIAVSLSAQYNNQGASKFKQLHEELPTPGDYRNGAGAPGHKYWQQKADYVMDINIDDKNQRIQGAETITYYNNSPDVLDYLWIQLDQNVRAKDAESKSSRTSSLDKEISYREMKSLYHNDFDGGFKIQKVLVNNEAAEYTINKTMMRIDLSEPLSPGNKTNISIDWWYNVNDGANFGGRSGYEYFEEEDNYMYHIAQFFPRMCQYNDIDGWQNKQFLGRGEFTLSFGDYLVSITAPDNHVVGATGELQNKKDVLSKTQLDRFEKAKKSDDPLMIITQEEAIENEKSSSSKTKTWVFKADNVRDFAFCSSKKFIWDAQGVNFGDRIVMAMSYYPKEGNPLWEKYSTRVVAHTLRVYSKYTFDYPYPTAISTHANFTGMEYPMICFNYGRPNKDGSYSKRLKYGMIGVIIHEVGHNFFPMIINSDERQWTWMDEGLNTFVQYLTECEWERDYPHRRGPAANIAPYMGGDKNNIVPIMSNSESLLQFGNNAYAKPATALNILRETVMGRALFDHAFKTYANRWKFKQPSPADFFRTMEDASGVDLDWFWRGWFFTTDHVDISLDDVKYFKLNTFDNNKETAFLVEKNKRTEYNISLIRNHKQKMVKETMTEKYPYLKDKYNDIDVNILKDRAANSNDNNSALLNDKEKEIISSDNNYYELSFSNVGGLVMPIILKLDYEDDTYDIIKFPAEIWKLRADKISKVIATQKKVKQFTLDPYLETADTNRDNNYHPKKMEPSKFELMINR